MAPLDVSAHTHSYNDGSDQESRRAEKVCSALLRYSIPLVATLTAMVLVLLGHRFTGLQTSTVGKSAFLLAIVTSAALGSRVARSRSKAQAALRDAGENLEKLVHQRTAELQGCNTDLQRCNAKLERLNEDLNQFAYSASHDLQEPLRMISIYSQLLERKFKTQLTPQADEYIHTIVQGAKRMDMLLKDLMAYVQAVNLPVENVEPVEGEEVLQKALANLNASISESKAIVTHDPLPTFCVGEVHLLQLLQNLIGNAIKYHGSEAPRVHIGVEHDGSFCLMRIQDNGIGIPAEHRNELFHMFKRLHRSKDYEGTGMGLAICQRIVERYGGRIWVESEEGQGSIFYFTLPLKQEGKSAAAVA